MTTTTLISAVTIGSVGSPATNVTKLVLSSTTGAVSLQMAVTVGALPAVSSVRVWYSVLADDLTADESLVRYAQRTAAFIDVVPSVPNTIIYEHSWPEAVTGQFLYVWVEEPKLLATATLTVRATEI